MLKIVPENIFVYRYEYGGNRHIGRIEWILIHFTGNAVLWPEMTLFLGAHMVWHSMRTEITSASRYDGWRKPSGSLDSSCKVQRNVYKGNMRLHHGATATARRNIMLEKWELNVYAFAPAKVDMAWGRYMYRTSQNCCNGPLSRKAHLVALSIARSTGADMKGERDCWCPLALFWHPLYDSGERGWKMAANCISKEMANIVWLETGRKAIDGDPIAVV